MMGKILLWIGKERNMKVNDWGKEEDSEREKEGMGRKGRKVKKVRREVIETRR